MSEVVQKFVVRFTRGYCLQNGPVYNTGEVAVFPKEMADEIVRLHVGEIVNEFQPKKSLIDPPKNKMIAEPSAKKISRKREVNNG